MEILNFHWFTRRWDFSLSPSGVGDNWFVCHPLVLPRNHCHLRRNRGWQYITISTSPTQIYFIYFIILNVQFCHFVCAKESVTLLNFYYILILCTIPPIERAPPLCHPGMCLAARCGFMPWKTSPIHNMYYHYLFYYIECSILSFCLCKRICYSSEFLLYFDSVHCYKCVIIKKMGSKNTLAHKRVTDKPIVTNSGGWQTKISPIIK
jgi:hypothetical protein